MNKYNNFTVEETNLLSIYMTGSKEGLVVAMNAALPFMEGEMRDFAARTLAPKPESQLPCTPDVLQL